LKKNYETITFELKENGMGILTLNRPEKLNAMSFQMIKELHQVFGDLMVNLNCRVLILRAEGRVFCAGLDLKESMILQSKKKPEELKKQFYFLDVPEKDIIKAKMYAQWRTSQLIVKMRKISQPIIAVIQGAASGAGFAFTLAADIRIAGKKAKFNNAFINVGFSGADLASSYHLPRLIGMSRAAELLYTGRFIEAKEANEIGLVLKVVEGNEEDIFNEAEKLAQTMLNKSPLGLRMTKQAINLSMDSPSLDTMIQLENRTQMLCSSSVDIMEGVQSFFKKKDPQYPLK
jgi:enoyl-CoA hydratase/carnithine racemase